MGRAAVGSSVHMPPIEDDAYDPAVSETWNPSAPGILRLPSGRLVRGRGLSRPLPDGPIPAFGVYLLGRRPPAVPWESRWLRWPDFRLPADEADVLPTLTEAWQRAATERVEIACAGGHGRTGTALACLAILDGVSARRGRRVRARALRPARGRDARSAPLCRPVAWDSARSEPLAAPSSPP